MEVAVKKKAKRRHLNAQECEELGQSADGTDVLTQPHTSNKGRGKRDPNSGLYPRTPTKRRRCAHIDKPSGSPSLGQKSINSFFTVSKVISTSPHKSSLPFSSACRKLEPNNAEEEEEEEEDDDVSLLAVPLEPQTEGKDNVEIDDKLLAGVIIPESDVMDGDDIDDISLLEIPMASDSEAKEQQAGDYLEGVTAEMFGAEDDFERCDAHGEEEVEALPDAHYGLLGSSSCSQALLQPHGCMEDLPEEVLREILSLVPAQDLYCSVSRVCHLWRNIVRDAKFVPFRKRYFRYTMRERFTVAEMALVLKDSEITHPATSQDTIRNLVILMAQHKVGERVSPDVVLQCVKKHRLYPQAEASIRLRIPAIRKRFHLDVEGPNPYAVMAVILLLSESVWDVQALVSRLRGCVSHTVITEYLSHMALMLLALKRNRIMISNKPHYNIHYVLHLLENGPFTVSSARNGRPQIHLTREQLQILSHDIQKDQVVKIIAFAGTGKTTTLVKYAERRPHLHFLYVAFNASVAAEARRCFPRNVECKTVHSLAYQDVGRRYQFTKKLTSNVRPFTLNAVLPKGHGGFLKCKIVATTLNAFMASTAPTIRLEHVPSTHTSSSGSRIEIKEAQRPEYLYDAQMIWSKMRDLKEKSREAYFMTHDGYLKLWQLQDPKPRLSDKYDVLFIDEAQDCTPVIMDVLLSQHCAKILVGDPHQQIYTFRGAVNALHTVAHTHIYYLTQSFRFGAEIAYVGATILQVCKRVEKILVGGKQKGGVCDEIADRALEAVRTGTAQSPGKMAILSRCNMGVFSEAVKLIDVNSNCRIHFIGDVKSVGLDKLLDLWHVLQYSGQERRPNQPRKYFRDPVIRSFAKNSNNPFYALKEYAEQVEDRELEVKLLIVERYRGRIPELVKRLQSCHESDLYKADFIFGTVHKAKGLEFDTVMINDDFAKLPSSSHNLRFHPGFSFSRIPDDEWNLLYVAVTRAKTSLIITKNIRRILTVAGEYLLNSKMPSSVVTDGNPLPCCIESCPNCITPGSAFVMCKQALKHTDGLSEAGPLCERCAWTRVGPTAFLMTDDVLSMAEIPQRLHRIHYNGIIMVFM